MPAVSPRSLQALGGVRLLAGSLHFAVRDAVRQKLVVEHICTSIVIDVADYERLQNETNP